MQRRAVLTDKWKRPLLESPLKENDEKWRGKAQKYGSSTVERLTPGQRKILSLSRETRPEQDLERGKGGKGVEKGWKEGRKGWERVRM